MKGQASYKIEFINDSGDRKELTFVQAAQYMESIGRGEGNTKDGIYGRYRHRGK